MDSIKFRLLSYLEGFGAHNYKVINSVLLPYFTVINREDLTELSNQKNRVTSLIEDMVKDGLILKGTENYKFKGGNQSEGLRWLDDTNLEAAITSKGVEEAGKYRKEMTEGLVNQSIIDTNNSIKWANEESIKNQIRQTKIARNSVRLGVLSLIFIAGSLYMSYYAFTETKTDKKLQDIEKVLQGLRTTIQNFPPSRVVIIDSTNHKKK